MSIQNEYFPLPEEVSNLIHDTFKELQNTEVCLTYCMCNCVYTGHSPVECIAND